jgi:excisionase family DNA binding protein
MTENLKNVDPEVITTDEAARLLRVNRKTLLAAIRRGEIPGTRRVGRALRIHRATLVQWSSTGQGQRPSTIKGPR